MLTRIDKYVTDIRVTDANKVNTKLLCFENNKYKSLHSRYNITTRLYLARL